MKIISESEMNFGVFDESDLFYIEKSQIYYEITWLAGPLAELKARLLMLRKIWNIELAVLDEELAGKYGLTC